MGGGGGGLHLAFENNYGSKYFLTNSIKKSRSNFWSCTLSMHYVIRKCGYFGKILSDLVVK